MQLYREEEYPLCRDYFHSIQIDERLSDTAKEVAVRFFLM